MDRVLQTQELRVVQEEESCVRVNTRELNRKLCTGLFTLYTKTSWSVLLYFQPTLNDYIFSLRSTCVIHAV